MTGCNFAIAESGTTVMFSNEGNARMVTTLPKTHIVMMGMERIIPAWNDLEVMANLLPRSATGQNMTVYMTALSGPRRPHELDGPDNVHVIILDNGRSDALGDPEFQEVLNCIRCGACLNVCPVYRQVGGHAYGAVYPGPIGAVINPILQRGTKEAGELAYASSLCGACTEACPVKIPLHDMLVHLRRRYVDNGHAPAVEKAAFTAFGSICSSPTLFSAATRTGRWMQLNVLGSDAGRRSQTAPLMKIANSFEPLKGWTSYRALPPAPSKSFRDQWSDLSNTDSDSVHRKHDKNGT
jgi:L-lactate dehydrogenase complex protein LldF